IPVRSRRPISQSRFARIEFGQRRRCDFDFASFWRRASSVGTCAVSDLCDRSPRKPLDENNRGFSHDSSALYEILSLARFDYASYRDSLRTFGGCNCSAPDYLQVGSSNEHLMKKILITGGAGFIGSHLVDRLVVEGNWRITVVDDFNDFYDPSVKRTNIESYLSN